jgi:glyoxylase-like metal-dependent hydrolase (beta-lactamase superfamily II)
MGARLDIISIGTLSRNLLWEEQSLVRTAHATTTLVRTDKHTILVDPGLPPTALAARLFERTGLRPDAIDAVFVTSIRAETVAGISLFENARWIASEREIDDALNALGEDQSIPDDADVDDEYAIAQSRRFRAVVGRLTPAPDKLATGIDLFPLPGHSAGTSGLLIAAPLTTTIIAGAAVPTLDHFLASQVLPEAVDVKAAQESMREVYEIADIIVPGFDNWLLNPRSQGM